MSLSHDRFVFTKNFILLGMFILTHYPEIRFAGKEWQRTKYQQAKYVADGLSNTMHGSHLDSMAIDLDFYINGGYLGQWHNEDVKDYLQNIGDFWCSLTPGNVWGGNWSDPFDPWHFQGARNVETARKV